MQVQAGALAGSAGRRRRRSVTEMRVVVDGLVRLGDVAVVAASGIFASVIRFDGIPAPDVATSALLLGVLLAAYILPLFRLYDVDCFTRLSHQLPRLLAGWVVTLGAVLAILFGLKSSAELSRLWVGYWFLAGTVGFLAWRLVAKGAIQAAHARGRLRRNLVLVGDGDLMADCLRRLGTSDSAPAVAAALSLGSATPALPAGCLHIRDLADLEGAIRQVEADDVILTVPLGRTGETLSLLKRLKHLPVEVTLYPEAISAGLPVFGMTQHGDAPLLRLMKRPLDGRRFVLKGLEDRILAALILLFISPVLLAVAAAVKLTSRGPVFYRQRRHGFAREPVSVFKFRTMYVEDCDAPDAASIRQATRDDPRVTPLGRWLRRTSFDELPQLLNVVRGEMSLVGPRPHALAHDNHYGELIDDYLGRHRVKPGITGWAQVNGCRGETRTLEEMRRRIELDLYYIENWSLLFDLRILLRTVFVGFRHANAY